MSTITEQLYTIQYKRKSLLYRTLRSGRKESTNGIIGDHGKCSSSDSLTMENLTYQTISDMKTLFTGLQLFIWIQ